MAETPNKFEANPPSAPAPNAIEMILSSATEAFTSAILVWFLGSIALGIAGSFAGEMIPSWPPGFGEPKHSETDHAEHRQGWWHDGSETAFACFFAIFFVHSLWLAFYGRAGGGAGRTGRILSRLRENWFSLIVGNAISAWVAALILNMVPSFSITQILWQCWVLPFIREAGHAVFGASLPANLGGWISWYDANHQKLYFWIIYLAGIFDDLGVPNFKTLARWAWRRRQKRKEAPLPASPERGDMA